VQLRLGFQLNNSEGESRVDIWITIEAVDIESNKKSCNSRVSVSDIDKEINMSEK
jgi:hypothetical protein